MALVVGDAAIGDDVLAGRVDPAGEFGEVRIDAAVDDGNLHALPCRARLIGGERSEEHTSELQSLMRISYAVFCLKKKKNKQDNIHILYPNTIVFHTFKTNIT